jgi:hypothetical protein
LAGDKPPGTRAEAVAWVVDTICEWRREADVPWKPAPDRLEAVLDDLKHHGIAEGLVIYIVLGCEWLLRVGKVTKADAEATLTRLGDALAGSMDPELAFWVTEVLAEPLRAKITREGRKLLALGPHLPMASPAMRQLFKPDEPAQRTPPGRLVPASRGRIPWPAPWVAGALVGQILERQRIDVARRPLKLTQALFGRRRQIELGEFKAHTWALAPSVLEWWTEVFEHRYSQRFGTTDTVPDSWGAGFYSDLVVLGPHAVFPSDPERASELLQAYSAARRRRRPKTRAKA